MNEPRLEAIVYKSGNNDFELWQLDIPDEAINEIEAILDRYRHRGCSVRGTMKEIMEDYEK